MIPNSLSWIHLQIAYKKNLLTYQLNGEMKIRKWKPELRWKCRLQDVGSKMSYTSHHTESRDGALEDALEHLLPKLA